MKQDIDALEKVVDELCGYALCWSKGYVARIRDTQIINQALEQIRKVVK